MQNLALLLSCSRDDFYRVVKDAHVKCDDMDDWVQCQIMYAGDYRSLVIDARDFNRKSVSTIWFVYMTQKF